MNRFTTNQYQTLRAEEAPFKPEALSKVISQQNSATDQAMGNNHAYAEELTPEGIQLVITGAERITTPTETDPQGDLW